MLAPRKKRYDQPRQRIKKQRHSFAAKVHLVQATVFPVVMYGCESWTVKKALVLEKIVESPPDCKEIKPVNPEGKSTLNIHWKD